MYCAVCQSHKSAIVVRSPSRTSTLTLRRDRLCIVELLYVVAAKMYELNFMFVCIWCYLCNSNNNVFKAHCLFTSFQPYTLSLVANMHLLSSEQYKGDLSTGQVFFFNTVITSCTLAQCVPSSFLALTLSTEGSLKLFVSPQMCISFGSTGV